MDHLLTNFGWFLTGFIVCYVWTCETFLHLLKHSGWNERMVKYVCNRHYKLIGYESAEQMRKEIEDLTHDPNCKECEVEA